MTSKSILKRERQNVKRRARNRSIMSGLKTQIKKLDTAIETKAENVNEILRDTLSRLDRVASKGVIHKNKASRQKSRLTKRVHSALKKAE